MVRKLSLRPVVVMLLLGLGLLLPARVSFGQAKTGPFTQPARSVRARAIDQKHIQLDLNFDWQKQQLQGRATNTLALVTAASTVELDAQEMTIRGVQLLPDSLASQPQPLEFTHRDNKLTIQLGQQLPAGTPLKLAVDYTVTEPLNGAHFVIPDQAEPHQPQMVWTQSEPEFARCWFPCFDSMTDRLTSEIVATVPSDYVVLSNGVLLDKKVNDNNTTTWHWSQTQTHSPYLLSVVAGDFEVYEQSWDGIPVQSYVPRGRLADAPRSFEKTPAMLQFFSDKIGFRYPWPKYAQICVDEYGWGGMEHTSATTLNLSTLHDARAHLDVSSVNLVAHELAHQWWGDLVTCKDWGELWLNESFATYFATLWTEHDEGLDEATWQRHNEAQAYMGEDANYRRSIVNYRYDNPMVMFDSHSYPKGGRVLHMLRYELGDDLFWRTMQVYAQANQYRTVETANLRFAIEEATGQGLNWFFDQWIHHGGHPEFTVEWTHDAAAQDLKVTIKQTQKVDEVTPLFRTSAELELAFPNDTQLKRIQISKAEETYHFPAPVPPKRVCLDPADWILKKLTPTKSQEEWLDQLAHSPYLMPRVQAVAGLAEKRDEPAVAAALRHAAQHDPFWGVRLEAVRLVGKLAGDDVRDALRHIARHDAKASVRREAVNGLANFTGPEVVATLREVADQDQSYHTASAALRGLIKLDRDNVRERLVAALGQTSDGETLLRTACDGLIDLKDATAAERISQLLSGPVSPERRVVLLGALARLQPGNTPIIGQLHAQLDNKRREVRRAAIDAVVAVGDGSSIAALEERRGKESRPRSVKALDEALEKLRTKRRVAEQLQAEVETLRKQNEELRERLKNAEKTPQQ